MDRLLAWLGRNLAKYLSQPRDFDISPYFAIVKPTLVHGFDYRKLHWEEVRAEIRAEQKAQ